MWDEVGYMGILYGYLGEQGQFIPKLDNPNGEGVLATASTTSLLVDIIGVAA